jgi:hypothetical protein
VSRAALVLVALALTLTGCETSAEKSATLEKQALRQRAHQLRAQKGLSIARESADVKVLQSTIVHSSEGNAAVVTLRNAATRALSDVPIAITVKGASGSVLYTNTAPGLAHSLVSVPMLPAHAQVVWIDDQVQLAGAPASVSAKVGEGTAATGEIPGISIQGTHLGEAEGAEGTVVNHSPVTQTELVVYALARRAGRIVAAGRAVLPQLAPDTPTRFQVFFIGSPAGAQLTFGAPPSTLG